MMGQMGKSSLRSIVAIACLSLAVAANAETPSATPGNAQAQPEKANSVNHEAEKYDTKLPVEISADNLEVFQHENKAIFKGNVIAVQGKIRLQADTMIIHYKQNGQQNGQSSGQNQGQQAEQQAQAAPVIAKSASKPSGEKGGEMGAITLIEVEGNVFMATPEESAKGDKGNYHVPEKMLHLTGDNVILTRDKNILRGTDLVYNLETGHSVLTNKGSRVGGTNGDRVRGVFVPNNDQSKDKNKTKDRDKAAPVSVNAPAAPAQSSTPAAAPPSQ